MYKSHNAFNRKSPIPVGAVQNVARLYEDYKRVSSELNGKIHLRGVIGDRIRNGVEEEKKLAIQEAQALKSTINELEQTLSTVEENLLSLALTIPNDTHPDTPIGDEGSAVVLTTDGPQPILTSKLRDHVNVGLNLDLLNLDSASITTGSSWYYLLNEGALLEQALIQYALHTAIENGFKPMVTPDVVKSDVASRCGFQPRDHSDPPVHQMYHLVNTNAGHPELVLSGTAEIPMAGFLINKIFTEDQLPLKYVGVGKAFRSEAGARGADTRGLYRVHQFTKIELFCVTAQQDSENMMKDMLNLQMDILRGLNLPIR